jgi:hypothetical protein
MGKLLVEAAWNVLVWKISTVWMPRWAFARHGGYFSADAKLGDRAHMHGRIV